MPNAPLHAALAVAFLAPPLGAQNVAVQTADRLVVLEADGAVAWEMPWTRTEQIERLPGGNLMVLGPADEIVEIEPSRKEVVWRFAAPGGRTITSFAPLGRDGVLYTTADPPALVEVDRLGEEQHSIPLDVACRIGCASDDDVILATEPAGGLLRIERPSGLSTAALTTTTCARAVARSADGRVVASLESGPLMLLSSDWQPMAIALPEFSDEEFTDVAWLDGGVVLATGGDPLAIATDRALAEIVWTLDRPESLEGPIESVHLLVDTSDAELLERARGIHRRTVTLDTHKDIRSSLASDPGADEEDPSRARLRDDPTVWGTNQVDFPKMRAGGLDVAFFIVYVGQGALDDEGFARAREQALAKFDAIERMCRRYPDAIELARTADDVERIAAEGKLVCCIGIENGYAMGTDLDAIEEFHERGARYMSITHNGHSQLGDSNTPADETLYGGLSDLGREAIAEMNRVGIMVDVSHASKETTLQAIAASAAPVIASHSGVDAVLEHGRNLSDDELRALAENGGVIQCVAFASYVKDDGGRREFIRRTREELGLSRQRGTREVPDDPEVREKMLELRERVRAFDAEREPADVADFVDHIDHAVEVAGIDHVAISSDFDGGGGIEGWNDASETFNVTLELVRRGYSEAEIAKLWSGNTLRVWRAVEETAARLAGDGD